MSCNIPRPIARLPPDVAAAAVLAVSAAAAAVAAAVAVAPADAVASCKSPVAQLFDSVDWRSVASSWLSVRSTEVQCDSSPSCCPEPRPMLPVRATVGEFLSAAAAGSKVSASTVRAVD